MFSPSDFVSTSDPQWKGYLYTALIVLVTFTVTILNVQAFYREYLVGLRIRTGLISAIYRKSLRLSNSARKEMTGEYISNSLSLKCENFSFKFRFYRNSNVFTMYKVCSQLQTYLGSVHLSVILLFCKKITDSVRN